MNLIQTKKKNAQESTKVMYGHEQICEVRKEINFWGVVGEFQEWVEGSWEAGSAPGCDLGLVSGDNRAQNLVHLLFCYS